MGLFDFIGDILGLSPPSTGDAMSREDIAWLMDKGLTANRTDKEGIFGGWNWSEGPDGRWTQTEHVSDALIPGIEKLLGKIGNDPTPYESPQQFSTLLDAMMGNRMAQYNQDPSGYAPSGQAYQPTERVAFEQPGARPSVPPTGGSYMPGAGGGGARPRNPHVSTFPEALMRGVT